MRVVLALALALAIAGCLPHRVAHRVHDRVHEHHEDRVHEENEANHRHHENHDALAGEWTMATRAPRPPTITFADDGASGFAGCNRWFGQVEHGVTSLRFSGVGATRMMCEPPMMNIERDFLGALEATRSYRIEGDTLVLRAADGGEIARFLKAR